MNHNGMIGARGVHRNSSGEFMANLLTGEVLNAEILGLMLELKMAFELNVKHLSIEDDSAVLIYVIDDGVYELHLWELLFNVACTFLLVLKLLRSVTSLESANWYLTGKAQFWTTSKA